MDNPSINTFPTTRNQESSEMWLAPSLGQEIYRMVLEYIIMSNNKQAIKDDWVV